MHFLAFRYFHYKSSNIGWCGLCLPSPNITNATCLGYEAAFLYTWWWEFLLNDDVVVAVVVVVVVAVVVFVVQKESNLKVEFPNKISTLNHISRIYIPLNASFKLQFRFNHNLDELDVLLYSFSMSTSVGNIVSRAFSFILIFSPLCQQKIACLSYSRDNACHYFCEASISRNCHNKIYNIT